MSDYYHQFLSSMSGIGAGAVNQQLLQLQQQQQQQQLQHQRQLQHQQHDLIPLSLPPHLHPPQPTTMGFAVAPNQYQNLGFYTGFPEPVMFNTHKTQRHRRKSAPGVEHVKHRRTRSGCYTCRSRRIKCDEGRPTCERCKKGKRECVYPEPPLKPGSTAGGSLRETSTPSQHTSPATSHGDNEDEDGQESDTRLDTIPDDDEVEGATGATGATGVKKEPETEGQPQLTAAGAFSSNSNSSRPIGGPRRPSTASSLKPQRAGSIAGTGPGVARAARQDSETPSLEGKSSSPSTSTGTTSSYTAAGYQFAWSDSFASPAAGPTGLFSNSAVGTPEMLTATPEWINLPQDLRFYLQYYCEHITHYHYSLPTDSDRFFSSQLPMLAMQNETLLYAVVGFSAYHYMLRDPGGRLQQFLQYYDRSVKLLLGFLKRKEAHTLGTLLTILQLATIEEYLGDWVNLMGHQKAALDVLEELFTPETVMQSAEGRTVLRWYSRFDVFVGLMGGYKTALPRAWFMASTDYYHAQAMLDPNNVQLKIEDWTGRLRILSFDMSILFARQRNGDDSPATESDNRLNDPLDFSVHPPDEAFVREHARILEALHAWKRGLDAMLQAAVEADDSLVVTNFRHAVPLGEDDIINPYQPGLLYHPPLFFVSTLMFEWESVVVMHELQAVQLAMAAAAEPGGVSMEAMASPESVGAAGAAGASGTLPPGMTKLAERAFAICQMFEAMRLWPDSPPGLPIMIHAGLAIAALFLPRDSRHHMWIRRRFALIESMGYIFPLTMRTRMAELFGDPSCVHWWLPHDEGFSPVLQSVRAFADERNVVAVSAQTENIREIRHIFSKMQLGGHSSRSSSSGVGVGVGGVGGGGGSREGTTQSEPDPWDKGKGLA